MITAAWIGDRMVVLQFYWSGRKYAISRCWFHCNVYQLQPALIASYNHKQNLLQGDCNPSQIARSMGPIWGPRGADRTQVGPMLAPWTLLSFLHIWFCCVLFSGYINPLHAKFLRGNMKHIFTFYVITPHWYDTGTWNPFSSKTRTYIFYFVNILPADVLAT